MFWYVYHVEGASHTSAQPTYDQNSSFAKTDHPLFMCQSLILYLDPVHQTT